jgi:hypothetical protein
VKGRSMTRQFILILTVGIVTCLSCAERNETAWMRNEPAPDGASAPRSGGEPRDGTELTWASAENALVEFLSSEKGRAERQELIPLLPELQKRKNSFSRRSTTASCTIGNFHITVDLKKRSFSIVEDRPEEHQVGVQFRGEFRPTAKGRWSAHITNRKEPPRRKEL